ncbi:hypothetical protein [Bdellovibrio bacteriovorus]|uniref:Uncharacterized protein n=1 Tax=Bdellovibrio bacteriovorus TaxID=959 RepID=A0A1Z3N7K7_BDEBC|nr:hypothetical protein [Bdellovibrio bacteriovorus]ASD63401.1 hypothetical protein B9G79_07350 [Bdellovibrio bacteriovorus]
MMKYVLMMLVMAGSVQAAPEKTAPAKKNQDVNFEDLLVSGQYHFSDEAVTTVEEDKVLNSLIGVRADFKDRMKQSATLGEVKNP